MPTDQPPTWTAPVAPVVVVRSFVTAAPFAAGGHRGIDLRTEPGRHVRAPCGGRVTFRGRVGGGPPTVTIDCGGLRATLQRVAPSVHRGEVVMQGSRVGTATARAVDLSARRPSGAYLDPRSLLRADGRVPGPAVVGVVRRVPRLPRRAPSRPARLPSAALVLPASNGSAATWTADPVLVSGAVGAVLLAALAAAAGAVARRRRRPDRASRGGVGHLARARR